MPRNGSGTMSISNSFVASTEIQSSPMNANFTDIASEITGSLPRDGQAGMTGQLKAANGTVSAPGICWGSDTDTGFYRSATGSWAFTSDGTLTCTIGPAGLVTETGYEVSLASGGTGASLADPNADRILFWDDSGGAVTWLTAGTGLAISTTTLALSHLGLESLTDPNADRILMWDDSAGASAWLSLSGLTITGTSLAVDASTTSAAGVVETATQAEIEAETSAKYPDAAVLKYHPGIAKAWVTLNGTGTAAISEAYNVSSITDNGTGDYTLNLGITFSSTNYTWCGAANFTIDGANGTFISETAKTASSLRIRTVSVGAGADLSRISVTFFGDL